MDLFRGEKVILAAKIAGSAAIAIIVFRFVRKLSKKKPKSNPPDTVILHHPGPGPDVPSLVPFAVKLETYLRMNKIPFKSVYGMKTSKKHKYPWIEYNGDTVADSEFIIDYLNKEFGINEVTKFSKKELGLAWAFQKMLEECTYWMLVRDRWVFDESKGAASALGVPFYLTFIIRRRLKGVLYGQGIGRHSKEEVYLLLEKDLKALSEFLGSNKFLLGDKPCKSDCAVFGLLSQIYWQSFGTPIVTIFKKYTNLCDYCERMKSTFWPDWNDCIRNGH